MLRATGHARMCMVKRAAQRVAGHWPGNVWQIDNRLDKLSANNSKAFIFNKESQSWTRVARHGQLSLSQNLAHYASLKRSYYVQ